MRYLFDIDGTVLTQQAPGEYEKAKPIDGRVERINALFDAGHQVVFFTSRNFKYMQLTHSQLQGFGFKYHHLEFGKPHADIIVDDRAGNWEDLVARGAL